jgi:hypothetical protein
MLTLQLAKEGFEMLGGRANLKTHFAMVERICRNREIACPTEASVRITIYNYTPGRRSYLGKDATFEIVGPGEYRLIRPTLDQL